MKRYRNSPEPQTLEKGDVTRLLLAWSEGDRNALEKLIPLVYDELRRLAEQRRCA